MHYQSKQPITQWQLRGIQYRAFQPPIPLATWVSKVWTMQVGNLKQVTQFPILPDGRSRLVFAWSQHDFSLWFGAPITKHYIERLRANVNYVGIEFHCGAAAALSPAPMCDLNNSLDDLFEFVFPNEQRDYWLSALNSPGAVDFIQNKTHQRLSAHCSPRAGYDRLKTAIALLTSSDQSVNSIAEQLQINRRQLHRLFGHHVGLSPVLVRRIARAQHVLSSLSDPTYNLTQLAHWANYHDQAHMNHDFLALFGSTPSGMKEPT